MRQRMLVLLSNGSIRNKLLAGNTHSCNDGNGESGLNVQVFTMRGYSRTFHVAMSGHPLYQSALQSRYSLPSSCPHFRSTNLENLPRRRNRNILLQSACSHPKLSHHHMCRRWVSPDFSLTTDIVDAPIGPRSTLYTEPSFLKECQYEFSADTESFISIAENLVIPYEWSTYDVLVLPKSFPYGGMENPNLTTVTPTLIAGDRSNVDVVAHEASHSWSGNLVTNATWEDFWLNEGSIPLEVRLRDRMDGVFGTKDYGTDAWK